MELTRSEIRSKQLELLDYIHAVCVNNNLTYFLAYGTLLGAVRHGGYIPWDDDIDVWMPRKDYMIFKNIVLKDNVYQVDDYETNEHCCRDYAKLVNEEIEIKEDNVVFPSSGLFVDIFMLDGLSGSREQVVKKLLKASKLRRNYYFTNNAFSCYIKKLNLSSILKVCYVFTKKARSMFFSPSKDVRKFYNHMQSISDDNCDYICCLADSPFNTIYKCIFRKEWFEKKEILFENRKYFCPKKYDDILKQIYGDYMRLPPENERINHGIIANYRNSK